VKYLLTEEFESILGVPITERGQNTMVRCPFHEDRVPSLSLELDKGVWLCFSCGKRGGIENLALLLDKPFDPADVALKTYDPEPDYTEPPDFRQKADELHERAKRDKPKAILDYLDSRGLVPGVFKKFRLGWDGERIAMPYFNSERVIGIKYRWPDGRKTNEPGTQRFLYNANDLRDAKIVFICEGESDTQALWSHGPANILDDSGLDWHNVGITGVPGVGPGLPSQRTWALWLLELITAARVYILFDDDDAGNAGSEIPLNILGDKAKRLRPTKGKDVASHFMNGGTLRDFAI